MSDTFIHLHVHSEYSIEDGLVRINELAEKTAASGMPAIAITEINNLFSTVKFYRAAHSNGLKPIIGSELRVIDEDSMQSFNIVLLCQNRVGYNNLSELITSSYRQGQIQGVAHINKSWLQGKTDGLICLSGGKKGEIGQAILAGNHKTIKQSIHFYQQHFPDRFYLELQRTRRENEERYIANSVELAIEYQIPVVATNDVCFIEQDDYEAHEARICIQQGYTLNDNRRPRAYSDQQYLKSADEMKELFHDIPEAIENTIEIARRCNLELTLGEHYLPIFPVPENYDQDKWLKKEANAGLESIFQNGTGTLSQELYHERLELELDVIIQMGFAGYFLIVADFIQWAKQNDIPVGPGRGSGAGSLVAYSLGITELDPIQYDLLFERFLNPERVSLPDFDVDFCMDRRDEVIDYVAEKYGRDHVSQIITYGSMAAKAVVRDVGRVLGFPYGFVDQLAKLIPFEIGITLDKALDSEDQLKQRYKSEEDVKTLIDLALKLEGIRRNAGKHAGGIVIAPKPLTTYMPLYCEQGSNTTVSQFDMNDVESIGLVKFDFLGLRTLTIIDWTIKEVNRQRDKNDQLDIAKIPLDDNLTYQLIQKMDTTAIFQLESDGMKKLIGRLKPDKFDDLIALVALFRPGPLQSGMVDDYVERKHGRSRVNYPHPELEPILNSTYGVILYQEQVMQIAQILAGYTLGAADLLRRAMGKKKPEEMAKQRKIFTEGAVERGVNAKIATYIFDLMEKFAGYGFNKSHSAAYALIAYQTAWLKAHYPAAFMSAVLSSDMDNTEKVVMLRSEIQDMGIELLSPDINSSQHVFTVADEKTIRYGLGAVKGVGKAAIEAILEEISENGKFTDLFDFCKRVNLQKVNRRVLEAAINCGAMDTLGPSRSVLMASLDKAIMLAEQYTKNKNSGQIDVFGFGQEDIQAETSSDEYISAKEWSDEERLKREKESLGFYLKGHPIDRYRTELDKFTTQRLKQLTLGMVTVAAYVHSMRVRNTSRGKMAELRLDDNTAIAVATVYSEPFQKFQHLLLKDQLVIIRGEVKVDDFTASGQSIEVKEVFNIDDYRANYASLLLNIETNDALNGQIERLKSTLKFYSHGQTPVYIAYNNGTAQCQIALGQDWRITVTDELLESLKSDFGEGNVKLNYQTLH